ncbi:hypothetical protein J7E50_04025 [Pedobacter sp. ISL-68]|uniref:hypothetical protein n=1 Tax=unclassified Pedobacter TaxID=2628915 RepID=UPI001BE5CC60|nr:MULTISPECIES: hypothetical protein [unclassified Pedobacter]MBT2560391.1 hypothetical protein [Pedobacter sp. ISL-64]MBT2589371.1 hypothetical protein [Pedobacter sp. ISL-68]
MKIKPILIEIAWLLGCAIIPHSIFFIILGNSGLNINLHDTYFVIKNGYPLVWFSAISIAFPLYFIKEGRHSFNRTLPFIIFLILGFGFNTLIAKASPFFLFYLRLAKMAGQSTLHYQFTTGQQRTF